MQKTLEHMDAHAKMTYTLTRTHINIYIKHTELNTMVRFMVAPFWFSKKKKQSNSILNNKKEFFFLFQKRVTLHRSFRWRSGFTRNPRNRKKNSCYSRKVPWTLDAKNPIPSNAINLQSILIDRSTENELKWLNSVHILYLYSSRCNKYTYSALRTKERLRIIIETTGK